MANIKVNCKMRFICKNEPSTWGRMRNVCGKVPGIMMIDDYTLGVGDGMVTETGNFLPLACKIRWISESSQLLAFSRGGLSKYAGNTSQQNEVSKSKEKA